MVENLNEYSELDITGKTAVIKYKMSQGCSKEEAEQAYIDLMNSQPSQEIIDIAKNNVKRMDELENMSPEEIIKLYYETHPDEI